MTGLQPIWALFWEKTSGILEELLVVDELDFNDKIIFSLCKEKNMVLLTNDSDFVQSDIDILSANPKLK